jgi:mono/diheme cytochrome c family protein
MKTSQFILLCLPLVAFAAVGCRQDMYDQPKAKPLAASDLFPDGASARPLVSGTIPRDWHGDDPSHTGLGADGKLLQTMPVKLTRELLERGHERFEIYCSECHDRAGTGWGMIVERGFPPPPSFHIDRLREAPIGHFYEVITNGYGAMYSYASRVQPADRWAIAAYIRALQLSQNARLEDVPEAERRKLTPAS